MSKVEHKGEMLQLSKVVFKNDDENLGMNLGSN